MRYRECLDCHEKFATVEKLCGDVISEDAIRSMRQEVRSTLIADLTRNIANCPL